MTPEEFPKLNRVILMRKPDGDGMVPIELITADVYPSFLKGDKYKIQVIGLPISISYYADEDAYSDSLPVDEEGQKWGIAEGTLFPSGFLYNHDPDRQEDFDALLLKDAFHDKKTKSGHQSRVSRNSRTAPRPPGARQT